MQKNKKNKIVVLIGAGGSGKTSVAKKLEETGAFKFAPTTTSRKIRDGEVHGVDYFFVDENEFKKMIDNGEMLEYIQFNGNYYGTNKKRLTDILKEKHCVVCIEENGAKKMKEVFPHQTLTIFIYVPENELKKRMKNRGDSDDHIKSRLKLAKKENAGRFNFDHIVENKFLKLDECVKKVIEITEKCK